jgi:hypothetical protein
VKRQGGARGRLLHRGQVNFQGGNPQASDGSGGRKQRLLRMADVQWRTINVVPFKGEWGWRY